MMNVRIHTDIKTLSPRNQSAFGALFAAYSATPHYTPYIFAALDEVQQERGALFAVLKRYRRWYPPFIFQKCIVMGEGIYNEESRPEEIFTHLLAELTHQMRKKCLLIEFRNIRNGRFGYKRFRQFNYFPLHWLTVYNSLHSRKPEERLFERIRRKIKKSEQAGVTIEEATDSNMIVEGVRLLRYYYATKPRLYCPPLIFFQTLLKLNTPDKQVASLLLVRHEERLIGASFSFYVNDNAHLVYTAGLRTRYPHLSPGVMAIWGAIKQAERLKCSHLFFTDVGLPFRTNPFRDFILSFGGTQQSTRYWYLLRWKWLNKILVKIYV